MMSANVLDRIDGADLRKRAAERRARERLNRIEEMREVAALRSKGLSQRAVADLLGTNHMHIARIEKAVGGRGGQVDLTPEEIILRAIVQHTSRSAMVKTLAKWHYTFGGSAPEPDGDATSGSWDDIEDALYAGLISEKEFEEIRVAARVGG